MCSCPKTFELMKENFEIIHPYNGNNKVMCYTAIHQAWDELDEFFDEKHFAHPNICKIGMKDGSFKYFVSFTGNPNPSDDDSIWVPTEEFGIELCKKLKGRLVIKKEEE